MSISAYENDNIQLLQMSIGNDENKIIVGYNAAIKKINDDENNNKNIQVYEYVLVDNDEYSTNKELIFSRHGSHVEICSEIMKLGLALDKEIEHNTTAVDLNMILPYDIHDETCCTLDGEVLIDHTLKHTLSELEESREVNLLFTHDVFDILPVYVQSKIQNTEIELVPKNPQMFERLLDEKIEQALSERASAPRP